MNVVDPRREAAVKHLKEKREFRNHLASYVVVNAMFVAFWAITGQGYFWPIWVILGWGVGLVMDAWRVYFQKPISEDEIDQEMRRQG